MKSLWTPHLGDEVFVVSVEMSAKCVRCRICEGKGHLPVPGTELTTTCRYCTEGKRSLDYAVVRSRFVVGIHHAASLLPVLVDAVQDLDDRMEKARVGLWMLTSHGPQQAQAFRRMGGKKPLDEEVAGLLAGSASFFRLKVLLADTVPLSSVELSLRMIGHMEWADVPTVEDMAAPGFEPPFYLDPKEAEQARQRVQATVGEW